jgi:hypothetical protein
MEFSRGSTDCISRSSPWKVPTVSSGWARATWPVNA